MKQVLINLDLAPQDRWTAVLEEFKEELTQFAQELPNVLRTQYDVSQTVIRGFMKLKSIPNVYKQEIQGISQVTKSFGLTYEDIVLFNIAVEYGARCTAFVHDEIFYKTLDWDLPEIKKLMVMIDFTRNGVVVYKATSFLMFVGILIGMNNDFSVTLNYRKIGSSWTSPFRSVKNAAFFTRDLLEEKDYEIVKKKIVSSSITPSYVVVSFGQRSFVVAKGGIEYVEEGSNLIQANHDRDVSDVSGSWSGGDPILASTVDRENKVRKLLSQGWCAEEVCRVYPICNPDTLVTVVMDVSTFSMRCIE